MGRGRSRTYRRSQGPTVHHYARIRMTSMLASRSLFAALLPIALAAAWPAQAHAQTPPQDPYDADDADADDDAALQPDDQVPPESAQPAPGTPAPNLQPPQPPARPAPPQ